MDTLQNLFILASGFTLLVLSGDKLVETSIGLAKRWKVPSSVVAVTIIAAGTSAPEFFTSFLAGMRGSSDISIGNVMGSNTFNILAVGGLSLLLQPTGQVSGTLFSWLMLVIGSLIFFFSFSDFELDPTEGMIFLALLATFLFLSFLRERKNDNGDTFENLRERSFPRTVIFFILSFGGLVLGAELALKGGVALGQQAGLSERVIAITIISVGTGLPELATSLAASLRGHNDIAIANVIGSNVFNTLGIPGMTASFFALKINQSFLAFDFYVMGAATLGLGTLYLINKPFMRRGFGLLMFLAYSAYATRLIIG